MNTVRLMLKKADSQHWESQGEREFSVLPRAGDLVEVEGHDNSQLYRVVTVVHSQVMRKIAGEVYAVWVGRTAEVLERLFKEIPVARSTHEVGSPIGFTPTPR